MIYKTSSLSPNLNEIDILSTSRNPFQAQVNTLGTSVKAYSVNILSGDGATTILNQPSQALGQEIRNKEQLSLNLTVDSSGNSVTFKEEGKKGLSTTAQCEENQSLQNGKDYQWNIRMYENHSPRTADEDPTTLVCSGFTVGSTTSVIWVDLSDISSEETKKVVKDQLKYDRWIEISASSKNDGMMAITLPNEDNLAYPTTWPYRERRQINWVYTDLGWNKDIIKIELTESFTYNYTNGKTFTLYNVSDQHTLNNFYVEPNDDIELGNYISLNNNDSVKRKIIGYGQETGEIRLQEGFTTVPQNGDTYKLWTKDLTSSSSQFSQKTYHSSAERKVGGAAITNPNFKIMTSYWNSEADHQIFVQPNINIKSDALNPPQIVWENGVRLNITQKISTLGQYVAGKKTDITFNKLDNTQWLLKGNCKIATQSTGDIQQIIVPQTDYTVYTDFMDSIPNAVLYARQAPTLGIKYKDYRELDLENIPYINIDQSVPAPWRDVAFLGTWNSINNVEIKYYHYYLYSIDNYNNETLIAESDDIYDSSLEWNFKGFETNNFYKVRITIHDKYGKAYSEEDTFYIEYAVYSSVVPLANSLICDEQAIKLEVVSPVYVISTDKGAEKTITSNDVYLSSNSKYYYADTTSGRVLNYTQVADANNTPIQIPEVFSFFTRFRFPYVTSDNKIGFFNNITGTDLKTLMEVAHASYTQFYLSQVDTVLYNELYSTLYTRQDNQALADAIPLYPDGISIVLYSDEATPIKDSAGKIVYYTLSSYTMSSTKIVVEEKIDTPVTSFDHYVYYDKVTKDEIGSSASLNNGQLDRRSIYLSIFSDENSADEYKKLLSYNKETGELVIESSLKSDSYNNLNYKAYTLKSVNNYIPLPSSTSGDISLGGDVYTVKVGGLDLLLVDEKNKIIRKNPNMLKMQVFKNGSNEPLACFNGGKSTSYDIQSMLSNMTVPDKFGFALQYKYTDSNKTTLKYMLVEKFKEEPDYMDQNMIYILTKDIVFAPFGKEAKTYYVGQYKYTVNADGSADWILQVDTEYLYLDESGDYKDEEGKAIDVVIDKDLTEGESTGSQTYTSISTNQYDTTLANAVNATSENKIFTTLEYNEKLATAYENYNPYLFMTFLTTENSQEEYTENGELVRIQIDSYSGNTLTLAESLNYAGIIYGYRVYQQNSITKRFTEIQNIESDLTQKGIVSKTSYVYLSVMNGTTTLIDKKKILTYTADKKLTIEGGVSILLSDSDLNSLTYTAYNYISNTYTELGKTGDGKIIASDPTGSTASGPVKYRWGPKNESGKEESDYIWMPDSQAVKQNNMAQISQRWFDFNLTVDNSKEVPVNCSIVLVTE